MRISVTEPVELALNHTKTILFDDFRFRMWLGLGFCAFLANGLTLPGAGNSVDLLESETFKQWANDHIELAIVLGIVAALIGAMLFLAILWLQSRGKFMFLDGVLNNRGWVKDPWRRFSHLGNNLFLFQILVILLFAFLTFAAVIVMVLGAAMPDSNPLGILLIVPGATALVVVVVIGVLLLIIVDNFMVPIMYRRNLRALDAFRLFREEIMIPHRWKFYLYIGMLFLLGIAAGILALITMCVTCCVAALPYVSSVVFLPLAVFVRLYSIYFLEQFGPDWWFFAREEAGETVSEVDSGMDPDSGVPLG